MEINEEIARRLSNGLGKMKKKYDSLKEQKGNLKKSIKSTNDNVKVLLDEFRTLSSIYPLETEKNLRQNLVLKYKLKKIKQRKQKDISQLIELQEITEKSIAQLALERNKRKKAKEKKKAVLEDLKQITEIVQNLNSMPSNETVISQNENKLKGLLKHNESEKQQLITTLYSLKQEFDKIDDTNRSLQIRLSSKIREISDCEENIASKDETISDLRFQIEDMNDRNEYLNDQYDENVVQFDSLNDNINSLQNNIRQNYVERLKLSKLIQLKQKKIANLKAELKKYCNFIENKLNEESLKLEKELNSQVQLKKQVASGKNEEIANLESQILKIKQENDRIIQMQKNVQDEINQEKESFEKYKASANEKLRSMQSVINSFTSNLVS